MNLEQLRTVIAVYREGSISRAAAQLGLTQPAVSGHVKTMEALIGRPLFTRHARGAAPTEAAEELAREVGDAFERAEVAFERVRLRSASTDGVVRMGAPAEFAGARTPPLIAQLTAAGFSVRLRLGGRDQLYDWLEDGEIDLGIVASEPQLASLDWQPVFIERLLLVGIDRYRPAPGADLSAWIRTAPWLAYDDTLPLIRSWTDKVVGEGARGAAAFTAPSLTLLRDVAVAGGGVTVLPDYLCGDALDAGALTRLHQPPHDPTNVISLCWRRRALRNPTVTAARDASLDFMRSRRDAPTN
ncbi:MAG: LysR family transcriptional regulator [Pseudomonadota bacterium]